MLLLTLLIIFVPSSTCSVAQSRLKRAWIIDSYEIEEGQTRPFPYVLGKASLSHEYQIYFDLCGQGVDEEPKGVFTINKNTGEILVQKPLDYEEHDRLELSFEARKETEKTVDTRLGIEILVQDINDNPPVFEKPLYEFTIDEDLLQGSHLHALLAYDKDKRDTLNSTFHYAIKSVSPETPNVEFFIKKTGGLSFNGCLDHEVATKYTLLVEAIDHGEVVSLSSSTTVIIHLDDGNNHLPVITGQTGSSKVNENEFGVSLLRLHVLDKDMIQSKAWRVRYTIHGDEEGYFKIETHTETNDGILTVVKALDFEDGATRELKISVENEAPYFSCEVKSRPSTGDWEVDFTHEHSGGGEIRHNSTTVIIHVVDVNEPPQFVVTVKEATLMEDAEIGTWVEKVTAVDRDSGAAREFIYKVGHDPAGWMEINSHTGDITTIKKVDRESIHVVDGVYTLILHAVDKGESPMTGTATLQIHLIDVNDNVPKLDENSVDVCLSDGQTPTNISATDPDGTPFGGPFTFQLIGDVKGKWKLAPSSGYTAGLVRDPSVYAGFYTLTVKVSDLQGQSGVSRLNVTVCSCSRVRNCRSRRIETPTGNGAIGIALASVILFLLVLLAAFAFSCKKEFIPMTTVISDDCLGGNIDDSNTEKPGTDCKVPHDVSVPSYGQKDNNSQTQVAWSIDQTDTDQHVFDRYSENNWKRHIDWKYKSWNKFEERNSKNFVTTRYQSLDEQLHRWIQWKLSSRQETNELQDYEPHVYREEGEFDIVSDLGYLTIPEDDTSFYSILEDLGPGFNQLASICMSSQSQTTSTKTIFMQHNV